MNIPPSSYLIFVKLKKKKQREKIDLNDIQVNRMQKKVRRTIFDTMKSKTQRGR